MPAPGFNIAPRVPIKWIFFSGVTCRGLECPAGVISSLVDGCPSGASPATGYVKKPGESICIFKSAFSPHLQTGANSGVTELLSSDVLTWMHSKYGQTVFHDSIERKQGRSRKVHRWRRS